MNAQHEGGQNRSDEESREELLPQMKQNGREWGARSGAGDENQSRLRSGAAPFSLKKVRVEVPQPPPAIQPPIG